MLRSLNLLKIVFFKIKLDLALQKLKEGSLNNALYLPIAFHKRILEVSPRFLEGCMLSLY